MVNCTHSSRALASMKRTDAAAHRVRFGEFELDFRTGELHRNGAKLRLQEQPFQILCVLLEKPGEVVTREKLRDRVWPADTFVDFDHGLYTAVTKLRETLHDSSEHPRFIETLPRRGYRFIASVETVSAARMQPSGIEEALPEKPRLRRVWALTAGALVFGVVGVAVASRLWLRGPAHATNGSAWVQITNFSDSVSQPMLSPDGHILTFIRGPDTFAGPGQIYVKMLPDGEPVQLTRDSSPKMSPVFSPDSAEIAYTSVAAENHWDTWVVPVISGQPHRWLPNASGLVWSKKGRILFSEIRGKNIHMGVVAAEESREGENDVYVPPGERGMAHRSYPSPDGKWALVVEMDRAIWLPCRLVPLDSSSPGREVGPPAAGCTAAAWSPDGQWMYLNSSSGGAFHIWRQRFSVGQQEQITSGPTEEEGIAMEPDGRSFITAVGLRRSAVWVHDSDGERQVSSEGYSYDPKFTPDGKSLCYRVLRGALPLADPSELRVVDLKSGEDSPVLPGMTVNGIVGGAYDISADGRKVVVSALDREGKPRLWLAPLDRSAPPRQIPNVEGQQPKFGPSGEIFFRAFEGASTFVYVVRADGTGLHKAVEQPLLRLSGVSRDGQWLLAKLAGTEGPAYAALSLRSASSVVIFSTLQLSDVNLGWAPDGKSFLISLPTAMLFGSGHTYALPLPIGHVLPRVPPEGLHSEAEVASLPEARSIDAYDTALGPSPEICAFARETAQRNLYRIPLP